MMKATLWLQGIAALGLSVTAAESARGQAPPTNPPPATVPATTPRIQPPPPVPSGTVPVQPGAAPAGTQPVPVPRTTDAQVSPASGSRPPLADVPGPIDSLRDVQDTLRLAFMAADQDHNGLISQQEAIDAGTMLVGGLFFTADADGDGKVTRQEGQEVRRKILQENPLLRFVMNRTENRDRAVGAPAGAAANANTTPNLGIVDLLDTDTDRALSAAEVRQIVTAALQTMFGAADTDRDGQLSPTELNAAAYGLAWAGVESAFQAADANRDNALSQDEFTKALAEPAKAVFAVLDADFNGQLTTQEIQRSGQVLSSRLRRLTIPRARNSVDRLVREARAPGEVAPTPEIRLPRPTENRRPNP